MNFQDQQAPKLSFLRHPATQTRSINCNLVSSCSIIPSYSPANTFLAVMLVCLYFIAGICSAAAETFDGKVVAIADGDTITVMRGSIGEKVRLDGIDAPEKTQDYGTRARQFVGTLAFGNTVTVVSNNRDRYGRIVGVVHLPNGINLNHEIVRNGYAWWYRRYAPNNVELSRLEAEARANRRGLWQLPNPIAPWDFRHRPRNRTGNPGSSLHSEELPIIGNRSSRVYHFPQCASYWKISPRNKVIFRNESEAKRAGYRSALNCL